MELGVVRLHDISVGSWQCVLGVGMGKILANRVEGGLFFFLSCLVCFLCCFFLPSIFLVGLVCWGDASPLATGAGSVVPMEEAQG